MDVTDLFDPTQSPEVRFNRANIASAALVANHSAAGQASIEAMKAQQQQTMILAEEKQKREQAAFRQAMDITSMFDNDEINGLLASTYSEGIKKSAALRNEYDRLSQTSFLDNPLEWIVNQFSKDQVAEQVNNIEAQADNARDHMRTIALQKNAAFQTAENASKILSDTAQVAQLELTKQASEQAIADKQVQLIGTDLNAIAHLQQGALQQIQLTRSEEQMNLERARFAMSAEAHNASMQEHRARLASIPIEAEIRQQQLDNAKLEYKAKEYALFERQDLHEIKKTKLETEAEIADLNKQIKNFAIDQQNAYLSTEERTTKLALLQKKLQESTNKLGNVTAISSEVEQSYKELATGYALLGYGTAPNSIKDIKKVLGNNIDIAAAVGSTGKLGYSPGNAIVNFAMAGRTPPEDTKEIIGLLSTKYNIAMEDPEVAKLKGPDRANVIAAAVDKSIKEDIRHWRINAEHATSPLKPASISTIITSNDKLLNDAKVQAVFKPMMDDSTTNMLTDVKSVVGRTMAAVKEGSISAGDAAGVISKFYTSAIYSAHVHKGLSKVGIDLPNDIGYTVSLNDNRYDMTKPAEVQRYITMLGLVNAMPSNITSLSGMLGFGGVKADIAVGIKNLLGGK